jgi:hypothetical protein
LRSTLIAAAVAIALLVTVVLPAEYGVDPTGIGRVLGLTEMGEIKVALAKEAALADSIEAAALASGATDSVTSPTPAAPAVAPPATVTDRSPAAASSADSANSHVTEIVLRPNEGKEIKLAMRKGASVTYSWSTDQGAVNYDTHADAPGIRYHGYAKGTGRQSDQGVLVAAFDGMHGWFWRNRGTEVVTVTLRTSGAYKEVKQM